MTASAGEPGDGPRAGSGGRGPAARAAGGRGGLDAADPGAGHAGGRALPDPAPVAVAGRGRDAGRRAPEPAAAAAHARPHRRRARRLLRAHVVRDQGGRDAACWRSGSRPRSGWRWPPVSSPRWGAAWCPPGPGWRRDWCSRCCPSVTWYAQNARSYALVTALATIASYLLVRAMAADPGRRWPLAGRVRRDASPSWAWATSSPCCSSPRMG